MRKDDICFSKDESVEKLTSSKLISAAKPTNVLVGLALVMTTSMCIPEEFCNSVIQEDTQYWSCVSGGKFIQSFEVKRLQNRLSELIKIFGDEEDEEVVAIREKAIENFKKVLNQCNNSLLKDWHLFSNNMGALSLEYMCNGFSSSICIGETHITYFVENKESGTKILGQECFDSESVISVMKKVL